MNVDALTIAAIADELRATVLGGRVERVMLAGDLAVGFEVYAHGRRRWLYASCHPQDARLHLVSTRLVRPSDDVSPLLLLLRKYVKDARIVAIEQPPLERILVLRFEKWSDGDCLETSFVAELMGRYSNLILVDAKGDVLDSAKRVTPSMNRVRVTLPRHPYVPPPVQDRADPTIVTPESLRLSLTMHAPATPVWRALTAAYRGISPLVAREIAYRGTGAVGTLVGDVRDWAALAAAQRSLFAEALAGRWQPCLGIDRQMPAGSSHLAGATPAGATGVGEHAVVLATVENVRDDQIVAFAPYRLTHLAALPVASISIALERFYACTADSGTSGLEPLKRRLRTMLAERIGRVQARVDALKRQLAQPTEIERLRTWGELILGFAHEIRPGQTELVVDDVRILLDPGKTAVENAQAYFREYQKAKHAAVEVPKRLADAQLELAYLHEVGTQIDVAEQREALAAIERELMPPATATAPPGAKRRQPRLPFRTERTPDGFDIVVGLTSSQNDEITFTIARPDDLWLHARGIPGAHVVVRTGGRPISDGALRRAAVLAARHSQARSAAWVAVDYTLCRYVRRIPGAPPGLVTYTHEQTIFVSPVAQA